MLLIFLRERETERENIKQRTTLTLQFCIKTIYMDNSHYLHDSSYCLDQPSKEFKAQLFK